MMKIIISLLLLCILTSCQSAREGFTLKKKDNSDEFLVEKKNPLIMPPNYEELPKPEDIQSSSDNKNEDEFKKVINSTKKSDAETSTKKTTLEQLVIENIN